jgi:ABC-2 type transport system permease protein
VLRTPTVRLRSGRGPQPLRLYWEVARRSYRRYATYRWATFAGAFTNSMFGLIRAYVLIAAHRQKPQVGSFDVRDSVTFTFVSQGMIMAISLFALTGIAERVRTGDVVSDLYRPVDFQGYHLAADFGRAAYHVVFRGLPPIAVGALIFGLRLPPDATAAGLFAVSLVLAVLVAFAMRFCVDLTSFWLLDNTGAFQIWLALTAFLAGLTVPLQFLPDAIETPARLLPWASMIQLPIEIFLGDRRGGDALEALLLQAFWAVALIVLGRVMLRAADRKLVIQGG